MRLLTSYCYADIRANPARHYFNDLECGKYLWSIHVTDLQSRTQVDLNRADLSAQRLDFDSIPIVDIARRSAVAAQIRDARARVGSFYVPTSKGAPRIATSASIRSQSSTGVLFAKVQ
jgi:hypothetical protein